MSVLHREFLELAVARLDGLLEAGEEEPLDAHLATCPPCRERAAAYTADRAVLRALRQAPAPRDLWSRTAAALDREQARPARWGIGRRGRAASSRATRGALATVLAVVVVAAVVGTTVFPGLVGPGGSPTTAQATPFAIQPSVLAYFSTRDGDVGVYMGRVDRVCPESPTVSCQAVNPAVQKVASFTSDFVPQRLAVAPDGRSAAVVGTSASGGAVYTLAFPDLAGPTAEPTASMSGEPSETPTGPVSSGEPTPIPTSVTPSGGPHEPAAIIDHVIVVGEAPAYSSDGTMLAFSAMPADGSAGPDIYLWRAGDKAAAPLTDDHASIFASWAGSFIVGSRAGEPLDGETDEGATAPASFLIDPATGEERGLAREAWRPVVDPTGRFVIYWDGVLVPAADGRTWQERRGGLYLAEWRLFDPQAEAPEPTPEPGETIMPSAEPTDEPASTESARPTESGTPGETPAATDRPTESPAASVELSTPAASAGGTPGSEPVESPSVAPTAAPEPGEPVQLLTDRDYDADPVLAWEVRWSPDGEWFGAWIGDRGRGDGPEPGPETGRLTVGAVDRASGRLDALRTQLDGAPAVRGFDLGDHRIAWATVPSPTGESEVRLLVWTAEGRGLVRTVPRGGTDTLPAL